MNINSILTSFWSSIKAYLGNNYLGKTAKAESAKSADSVAWDNVSDKPSTYTPSSHTHDDRYYTETEIDTKLNSKANISDLSTVATSGSYNDLSDKPTIPTKVSDLTNDGGFLTGTDVSGKADKATTLSGYGITDAYTKTQVDKKVSDLVNSAPETLDTLNELASALGNDPNFATTVANQIGSKANISDLSTVATSGSYNDLSDKPTIPTVNNATLAIQKNGTTVKTFTANASSNVTCNITVPTKVSDLTNDSGYLTQHQSLENYVTRADAETWQTNRLKPSSVVFTVAPSDWQNGVCTKNVGVDSKYHCTLGVPVSTNTTNLVNVSSASIIITGHSGNNLTLKCLGNVPTSKITLELTVFYYDVIDKNTDYFNITEQEINNIFGL